MGKKGRSDVTGASRSADWTSFTLVLVGLVSLKCLFIYNYYSTDFEPLARWYFDNSSQWTLDYPPLFAHLERVLAAVAVRLSPSALSPPTAAAAADWSTVVFQRCSVIGGDVLFALSAWHCASAVSQQQPWGAARRRRLRDCLAVLLCCSAALLLVDNIHFQYNAFLTAFQLFSIADMLQGRHVRAAFWYCVLVNLKHIYLYTAPAYASYLLYAYCARRDGGASWRRLHEWRCARLGAVAVVVFGASFGPFAWLGVEQLRQIARRLFPVQRGLTHAYWAPNFWALYNSADLALYQLARRLGLLATDAAKPVYTSGLVQEYGHAVLPTVAPHHALLLTLATLIPFCLLAVSGRLSFLQILTASAWNVYLFGWHVHEKAVLLVTVPLLCLAASARVHTRSCVLLTAVAHVSLFPLLFTGFEQPIKYALALAYLLLLILLFSKIHKIPNPTIVHFASRPVLAYFGGWLLVELYSSWLHGLLGLQHSLPFVPLMLTSVYCSLGMFWAWLCFCSESVYQALPTFRHKRWARRQDELKQRLRTDDTEPWQQDLRSVQSGLKVVGGVDISASLADANNAVVCLVVLTFPDLKVVAVHVEPVVLTEPYVAGYLAFREADAIVRLLERARADTSKLFPQLLLIDGNGVLHPRGFGLASHVGVLADMPTVGVAKNLHMVEHLVTRKPAAAHDRLGRDRVEQLVGSDGAHLGNAIVGPGANKPVFVSVGHRISLATATQIVHTCSRHRVPEPIRQADIISRQKVREWYDY